MEAEVLHCLRSTLSPNDGVRRQAEEKLHQLFLFPNGGLTLANLLLSQDIELPQRQIAYSAGILLQQYIARHWSTSPLEYEEPLASEEIKAQIRPILLAGLSDPQSRIRNASAFAMSTVARYDWPDEYPDLLDHLVQLLTTGSSSSVHGAMRVVQEFVKNDLSEDQLLPVVQHLAPALLAILGNPADHSAMTRASTLHVFRQVIRMLETVRDEHPQAVRQALEQLGSVWFRAFQELLGRDAEEEVRSSWESIGIRLEIFRTLSLFQNAFPRLLISDLPTYLRLSTQNLLSLLPTFQAYYLSSDPDAPDPPTPPPDVGSGTTKMDLDDLVCAVFDFLTPVVRTPKAAESLMNGDEPNEIMEQIVGIVLEYTQVTRANEEEWLADPNTFLIEEDEETEQYGLRTEGHDLIGSLIDKWPRQVTRILQNHTTQRVQESAAARQSGIPDWWKPLEGLLALLGGIADDLRDMLDKDQTEGRDKSFDVQYLFDQVIPGLLDQSDTPFLQGRAFVFASQFASLLPEPLAVQYLAAAVSALASPNITVPVKISAVKTIKNFCRFIDASILKPQSAKVLSLLLPLLSQTTSETLYLLLETIRAILNLDKDLLTPESIPEVAEQTFNVWLRFTDDPVLTAIVEELYEALTALPLPVVQSLVRNVAPRLANAISTPVTDETLHLPGEAIQLANALLRARGGPLEQEMVTSVSAATIDILNSTDDMDVIQHGMIHLTLVVRKDCDKLVGWQDAAGNNGIACIFRLLGRFLAPTFSESGGIFVGELIMHLFRKAGGTMGPVLPDLLRAVVNRLAYAKLPSFIQSLVLPFAYLFSTEYTTSTLDLLSGIEVSMDDGLVKNGLEVVLAAWCDTSETINGSWNIRVSDLGMAKLFILPDPRLRSIIVKGDLIISEANRDTIMTRSRTKVTPNQYTQIPFVLKAFKLLLKDVQAVGPGAGEGKGKGKAGDVELDDDDGDEEWDDDDPLGDSGPVGEFDYLSSWLDDDGGGADTDAQDDDEDLKSDPIAQIDLGQHLIDTLRQCYTTNSNGMHEMIEGLNEVEKGTLRGVLTL